MRRAYLRNCLVSDVATDYRIFGNFSRHFAGYVYGRHVRGQCDALAHYFIALPSVKGLCAFGVGHWCLGFDFAFRSAHDRHDLYRCGNLWIMGTFPARDCLRDLSFVSDSVDGCDPTCDCAVDRVNASRGFVARFFFTGVILPARFAGVCSRDFYLLRLYDVVTATYVAVALNFAVALVG